MQDKQRKNSRKILSHGSLFSGIGGFDLAAEWMGWTNAFHCEINPFCQTVLKYHFPHATSYGDITSTDFTVWRGRIDVLTGGFPCQDASKAKQSGDGKRGLEGDKTKLFFEMCRAIREILPRFVVAENVENILKVNEGRDFGRILSELAGMGYDAEWRVCYASEVGAPHKRPRLYLVAYSRSLMRQRAESFLSVLSEPVTPQRRTLTGTDVAINAANEWLRESPVYALDDGLPAGLSGITLSRWRTEAIKAAGNAVVPQVPYQIFKAIEQYETL